MSASGRTPSQSPYHSNAGYVVGHHWSHGRQTLMEPCRRRHPSDSPAPLPQHAPYRYLCPPYPSAAYKGSSGSVSSYSQQSSNPRSPTGSCYSEGDVFPLPSDYPPNSLVENYYRKPLPPPPVGSSLNPAQWHFDNSELRRRWSSASAHLPYNCQWGDSYSGPRMHPADRERYATVPYAQPAAVERNIYERVCDVQYGTVQPGPPLQAPRTAMESHRAPLVQSVESVGNGSVRSGSMTDYPRQWEPDRRVRSRETVTGPPPYAHPPSHSHNTRTLNGVHYRQDSSDSGSYYRGESGNHGNQTTYHSPDSGDSGFLSHPSCDLDSRGGGGGQTHIYSEIGRLSTKRLGFQRAQTVPTDMWPEANDCGGRTPPADKPWFAEDDVDVGYANSTIPDTKMAPIAGKPNGRYFLSTPERNRHAKEAPTQPKSNPVHLACGSPASRSRSATLNKLSRKLSSKKKLVHQQERETPSNFVRVHRSNSMSYPSEHEARRAQSLELLDDSKRTSVLLTSDEGSRTVAAVLTPKLFRNPKLKKVSDGDSNSLTGSLTNLLKGEKRSQKKNSQAGVGDTLESLYLAILNQDLTKVQSLLELLDAGDLNGRNEDGFSPLDLAVMCESPAISRLLQSHGARDSQQYFRDPSVRLSTLSSLINECEHEITLLMMQAQQAGGYTTSSVAKELGRQLQHWEWRRFHFKQMKQLCHSASPPGPPKDVRLTVTSSHKLTVTFAEADGDRRSGNIITRYRVEWSQQPDFSEVAGERTMTDVKTLEYTIPDLKQGDKYYVRVSACNLAGFGEPAPSVPSWAVPSSWHDIDSSKPRYDGSFNSVLSLGTRTKSFYTQSAAATVLTDASSSPSTSTARQKSIKKGITKLFGSVIKYHKTLKSGLYLALLLYSTEDRVLVTVDDNLPIVEVGDEYNRSTLGTDISWLNKVLCASDLVKALREWSGNCTSSPNIQFRHKLLSVVGDLQLATGVQDLGLLYPVPYFDAGTTVLVIVNSLDQPRSSQGQSLKWSTVSKLCRKKNSTQIPASVLQVGGPIPDRLALDAQELIWYHQKSHEALPRGLYLGYYQAMSTVGYLKMVVAKDHPNVIPHCKIRDCPNVSREEWEWLQSLQDDSNKACPPSELVKVFQDQLRSTVVEFLQELAPLQKDRDGLRLYTCEVVELNEDVSFLVVMPPPERVCMPPGSEEAMREIDNTITMPIPLFDIVQYQTYQQAFLKMYAQLSARLELELAIAQHKRRQAFTKQEMTLATEAYASVERFHSEVDSLWHGVTWIDDAVKKGRDTQTTCGIPLSLLLAPPPRTAPPPPPTTSPPPLPKPSPIFIKVQPLYNTGLAVGTTVKLNCNQSTTGQDVIRLTALQIDKARRQKGKPGPALTEKNLSDFYMTVVCGDQESVVEEKLCVDDMHQRWPNCRFFLHRHSEDSFVTEHGPCTSV